MGDLDHRALLTEGHLRLRTADADRLAEAIARHVGVEAVEPVLAVAHRLAGCALAGQNPDDAVLRYGRGRLAGGRDEGRCQDRADPAEVTTGCRARWR